jgi:hypothetical protein
MAKSGRNAPCPCGSGRKHKQCCLGRAQEQRRLGRATEAVWERLQEWTIANHPEHLEMAIDELLGDERKITPETGDLLCSDVHLDRQLPGGGTPLERFAELSALDDVERAAARTLTRARLGPWRVRAVEPGLSIDLEEVVGERLADERSIPPSAVFRSCAAELLRFAPPSRITPPSFFTFEGDEVVAAHARWVLEDDEAGVALERHPDLMDVTDTEDREGICLEWTAPRTTGRRSRSRSAPPSSPASSAGAGIAPSTSPIRASTDSRHVRRHAVRDTAPRSSAGSERSRTPRRMAAQRWRPPLMWRCSVGTSACPTRPSPSRPESRTTTRPQLGHDRRHTSLRNGFSTRTPA